MRAFYILVRMTWRYRRRFRRWPTPFDWRLLGAIADIRARHRIYRYDLSG